MRISRVATIAALTLLGLAGASGAQTQLTITDGHEREDLTAQGWTQVAEGLWQRTSLDGRRQETFVSGAAGLEKVLPSLREQLQGRMDTYLNHPTTANKRALDEQSQLIDAVETNLRTARGKGASPSQKAAAACTRTYGYAADVRIFHCYDIGDASASYSTSNATACPEECTVHTYAYVSGHCSGVLHESSDTCDQTGTNVSCYSYTDQVYGGTSCYQYAYASVHCPQLNNLYLTQSDYATTCVCSCI